MTCGGTVHASGKCKETWAQKQHKLKYVQFHQFTSERYYSNEARKSSNEARKSSNETRKSSNEARKSSNEARQSSNEARQSWEMIAVLITIYGQLPIVDLNVSA